MELKRSNDDSPTMSVDEAARMLGLSRDLVYDGVRRGEIASVRVGRRIRVARAPLLRQLGLPGMPPPMSSES